MVMDLERGRQEMIGLVGKFAYPLHFIFKLKKTSTHFTGRAAAIPSES